MSAFSDAARFCRKRSVASRRPQSPSDGLTFPQGVWPDAGMSDAEPAPTVAAPPPGLWARACIGERQALAQLAERFWFPVYAWLRVCGTASEDAARQCRDFFSRMDAAEPPARDEPTAARFREYVLAQLKAYLVQGCPEFTGPSVVEFDAVAAEQRLQLEPGKSEDEFFTRKWAFCVLEASVLTLQAEYAGEPELFATLKPFLGFHGNENGYSEAARSIGMSASAFHLQAFNFRKRYRATLRAQIGDTVRHADDLDSELTVLLVGAT